ncbi:MAG: helix-turn-helix transcriptional regulator [Lachnospiraceae bacterium]|nr:helix-turn-helix transcriptional regulator [Lachnospiraceae bacterium]
MNERIKQLRKTLGMTQQEFAEKIGVKRNTIAQYEIGRNEPIESVINLICKQYNINIDWLKNGSGEMFVAPAAFSLDEYAAANALTDMELNIIRGFMELEPKTRDAIYDVFRNAFKENSDIPDEPQELEDLYPTFTANSDAM